jgi:hypothetical protein
MGMDDLAISPVLRLIPLAAAVGALVFALAAKRPPARVTAWGLVFACWLAALCMGGNFWESGFDMAVSFATVALPPVALVLASWRLPRGRADTVTAEIGLLVGILIAQWIVVFSFSYDDATASAAPLASTESAPVEPLVWFLFLAAAFVAAAVPVPTRRIAYGAAALSCVLLGVFREVLLWSETGQHPDVPFNDDLLVGAVYVGIPVIGAALQLLWWARNRRG